MIQKSLDIEHRSPPLIGVFLSVRSVGVNRIQPIGSNTEYGYKGRVIWLEGGEIRDSSPDVRVRLGRSGRLYFLRFHPPSEILRAHNFIQEIQITVVSVQSVLIRQAVLGLDQLDVLIIT